ncbi:MAG TPA: hypothetical protein VGP08_00370 [Pyrinomonadaceae bacterium]|jgi:hypothetical protein|nr:hypothetical protein [Pyrinomonadaceae bacterium]
MSSEQDRVRELAERVARRLADSAQGESSTVPSEGGEMDALRESLSEIQRRLARIESRMTNGGATEQPAPQSREGASPQQPPTPHTTPTRSMWLSGTYVPATSHPSQEQFTGIGEAVSELVEFFEREKTCTVEPGGKPCDHCGTCSSRGF